jgi:putative resolvase
MRPHEFAKKLSVTVKTLQRWDKSGKLPAKRTPTNHRYYTPDDVALAQGLQSHSSERRNSIYCRVSSAKQKAELENQRAAMEAFFLTQGIVIDEIICEIGGGLNFKRKDFLRLIFDAIDGKIALIGIAHKDRLCRFAFELIETILQRNGCKIIVANQTSLSPTQELVEDMLAIVHCFSCRIYGSRTYGNKKTKAFAELMDIPGQAMLGLRKEIDC